MASEERLPSQHKFCNECDSRSGYGCHSHVAALVQENRERYSAFKSDSINTIFFLLLLFFSSRLQLPLLSSFIFFLSTNFFLLVYHLFFFPSFILSAFLLSFLGAARS
jgi:hypothetical protein